jgi:hypothetical protein
MVLTLTEPPMPTYTTYNKNEEILEETEIFSRSQANETE